MATHINPEQVTCLKFFEDGQLPMLRHPFAGQTLGLRNLVAGYPEFNHQPEFPRLNRSFSFLRLRIYALRFDVSSSVKTKFGMVECGVMNQTERAITVNPGLLATS